MTPTPSPDISFCGVLRYRAGENCAREGIDPMTATRDVCSAHGAAEWPGPWLGRPGFCLSSVSHEWRHRNKLTFRPRIWVAGFECPENVIKIPARVVPHPSSPFPVPPLTPIITTSASSSPKMGMCVICLDTLKSPIALPCGKFLHLSRVP